MWHPSGDSSTVIGLTESHVVLWDLDTASSQAKVSSILIEPHHEKTCLQGFQQKHGCIEANLKNMLVCCLPTQKLRGGSVGRHFILFFLIVEVGRSVGFFFFLFFLFEIKC